MLWIAVRTLRDRWLLFVGSFVALTFGVALVATTTLVIAAAANAEPPPPQGAGRYDAAAVVVRASQTIHVKFGDDETGWSQDESAPERIRLPRDADRRLAGIDGVRQVVPDWAFPVGVQGYDIRWLGRGWSGASLGPHPLTMGQQPGRDDVVVPEGTAGIGDRVEVVSPAGTQQFTVSGLVAPVKDSHGTPAFFADDTAARLSGDSGRIDAYGLLAAPGVQPDELAQRVRDRLQGTSWRADTGADKNNDGSVDPFVQQASDVTALMATTAVVAGFVSIFVVASTFAFTVASRRTEIALLRTIGASPTQVRSMITRESFAVGVVASAVGCLIGLVTGPMLGSALIGFGLAPEGFTVPGSPLMLLISFVTGLLVSMLGVSAASRRAAKVRPIEALREASVDSNVMTRSRWLAGFVFVAASVVLVLVLPNAGPEGAVPVSIVLTEVLVVALAALAPIFLPGLVWLAGLVLSRVSPHIGLLARQNVRAGVRRTVSTAAPVMVTVSIAVSMLTIGGTISASAIADSEQRTKAQYIAMAESGAGIPESTVESLRRDSAAVTAVVPTKVLAMGSDVAISVGAGGVDPDQLSKTFQLTPAGGSLDGFGAGSVVVTAETADMVGWHAGDQVDVVLGDGTRMRVKVAAVLASGGSLPGMLLPRDLVLDHVHARMSDVAYIAADRPVSAPGVKVVPINDWLTEQAEAAGRANRVIFILLIGMAMLYSGLAIANTLLMSSGLRLRDVALLRLVGATGDQVMRMFMWETLMTIAVGVVLGCVAALVSIFGVYSALSSSNPAAVLSFPVPDLLVVLIGCVGIALAASLIPARLALRARPLDSTTTRL